MTTLRIGNVSQVSPVDRRVIGPPRPPIDLPEDEGGSTHGKMTIKEYGSDNRLLVPYAPREVTYSGLGSVWEEVPRDGGRTPLLVRRGKQLKKMSFQIILAHRDWDTTVTDRLDKLLKLAQSTKPLVVTYSNWEAGLWRITNFSVSSMMRNSTNGKITRATCEIEFTRASDAKLKNGPVNGGNDINPLGPDGSNNHGRPKKYTVKKGDTLQSIGQRFYHNHKAWRKIAKANKIKNPNKTLKPGTVLRLP